MAQTQGSNLAFTQTALTALNEIDQAMSFHLQWLQELHQTLICQQPVDDVMAAENGHLLCKFGQWYTRSEATLGLHGGYLELGASHRAMHDQARIILQKHARREAISLEDYARFMDSAHAFRAEAHKYQAELINQVCVIDHLTGAWNRFALSPRINEESERARRTGQTCCISMLDLDNFKQVNDRYGHLAGDTALQTVARFLSARMRKYDTVFRFGGEEFLICLPNTSLLDAEALLNRMRVELSETDIVLDSGDTLHLTASFGVTPLNTLDTFETSLDRADHALLCAKAQGRNCVCAWPMDGTCPSTSTSTL